MHSNSNFGLLDDRRPKGIIMALENIESFIERQTKIKDMGRRRKSAKAFLAAIGRRGWVKVLNTPGEYMLGDFRLIISLQQDAILLGNNRSIKLGRGAIEEFDAFMLTDAPHVSL